jgi:hypothetical protein
MYGLPIQEVRIGLLFSFDSEMYHAMLGTFGGQIEQFYPRFLVWARHQSSPDCDSQSVTVPAKESKSQGSETAARRP